MTVEEFMGTTLMHKANVLAGECGMTREIFWFATDDGMRFDGAWTPPGGFLIYTGKGEIKSLEELMQKAKNISFSAVLLYGEPFSVKEHTMTLERFEELNTPLIWMKPFTNVMNFLRQALGILMVESNNNRYSEGWLREICRSEDKDLYDNLVVERLGYRADCKYYCVLLEIRNCQEISSLQMEMDLRQAEGVLISKMARQDGKLLSFMEERFLSVFLPFPKTQASASINRKLRTTARELRGLMNDRKWQITVGSVANSFQEFKKSYVNAIRTAQLIEMLQVHEDISFYSEWYAHMLLIKTPKEELEQLVESTLAPILKEKEFLETLVDYLTFGESLKTTSKHMYIHVNTLKYRLQKIGELLDCDLKDPSVRFRLRIAITAYRYLGNV